MPLDIYPLDSPLPKKSGLKIYPIAATLHPDTLSWRDRAIADSGLVEDIDLIALNPFVEGVYDLGLRSRIDSNHQLFEFVPLVGGNLTAALIKLWFPTSAPTITNFGFVSGQYARSSGLTGNGFSYLNSHVNFADIGVFASFSLGAYNRTFGGFADSIMGADMLPSTYPRLRFIPQWVDNNAYFDCYGLDANGSPSSETIVIGSMSNCLNNLINSRFSATLAKIYRNTTVIDVSTAVTQVVPPNYPLTYFAVAQSNGNTPQFVSSRSLGCLFMSSPAIPENKISTFNTLVQNLMTALGRAV